MKLLLIFMIATLSSLAFAEEACELENFYVEATGAVYLYLSKQNIQVDKLICDDYNCTRFDKSIRCSAEYQVTRTMEEDREEQGVRREDVILTCHDTYTYDPLTKDVQELDGECY